MHPITENVTKGTIMDRCLLCDVRRSILPVGLRLLTNNPNALIGFSRYLGVPHRGFENENVASSYRCWPGSTTTWSAVNRSGLNGRKWLLVWQADEFEQDHLV